MHEVSIVEGLIDLIEKKKTEHHFSRVQKIQIACGPFNCVSEESLNFCLQSAAQGTYLAEAVIVVNRLPELWKCIGCKKEFVKDKEKKSVDVHCALCGSGDVAPILNSDIYLDNLEVE